MWNIWVWKSVIVYLRVKMELKWENLEIWVNRIQPQPVQSSYCDLFSSLLWKVQEYTAENYCEIIWCLANKRKSDRFWFLEFFLSAQIFKSLYSSACWVFCVHFLIKPSHFLTNVKYVPVHVKKDWRFELLSTLHVDWCLNSHRSSFYSPKMS